MTSLLPPLALASCLVAWGADWDRKPMTDWSQGDAFRLLTDSPWSRKQGVGLTWIKRDEQPITYKDVPGNNRSSAGSGLGPLGGIGPGKPKFPQSADLIFRWASALPVRHATAVYRRHDERLPATRLNSLIPQPEADYVLEIFGVPVELAHMGAETLASIAKTSIVLRTAAGRTLHPNGAKVTLQGDTLSLQVHFPKAEPIELADRELEADGDLQILKFRVKFKLSPMTYQGRLEL